MTNSEENVEKVEEIGDNLSNSVEKVTEPEENGDVNPVIDSREENSYLGVEVPEKDEEKVDYFAKDEKACDSSENKEEDDSVDSDGVKSVEKDSEKASNADQHTEGKPKEKNIDDYEKAKLEEKISNISAEVDKKLDEEEKKSEISIEAEKNTPLDVTQKTQSEEEQGSDVSAEGQNSGASAEGGHKGLSGNSLNYQGKGTHCHHSQNVKAIVLGLTIPGLFVTFLLVAVTLFVVHKRRNVKRSIEDDTSTAMARKFKYSKVIRMTDQFSNQIGTGSFGKVFYGHLPNGKEVAVKVLSDSSKQDRDEFKVEVSLLSQVHHRNLVDLVDYCCDSEHCILIYEYIARGSLNKLLRSNVDAEMLLDWEHRIGIALVLLDICSDGH